jgi:hypothetical protein
MLIRTGSLLILALLSFAMPAGSAQADPSACPGGASGFMLWDVDTEPYLADNRVDAAGNDNGWVCARELPGTFVFNGQEYPIQNFIDDHM